MHENISLEHVGNVINQFFNIATLTLCENMFEEPLPGKSKDRELFSIFD